MTLPLSADVCRLSIAWGANGPTPGLGVGFHKQSIFEPGEPQDWFLRLSLHRNDLMDLTSLSDESLLRYYEGIRVQVSADIRTGYRLVGQEAKDRANAC